MYNKKAIDILNSAISSAVFIDEKAKDFFSDTPIDTDIVEEKLSVDLFKTFKENGKNLTVHKFKKEHRNDPNLIQYLFSGKDLILLDWDLDDITGHQYSLDLLAKSIETPNINFCCIYSRSANFNNIPNYLTAYFSAITKEKFEIIKETYSYIENKDIEEFYRNPHKNIKKFFSDNEIKLEEFPIEKFKDQPKSTILRLISIALENDKYYLQEDREDKYDIIYSGEDSFIINNTFVLAIKKEEEDSNYNHLIERIASEIIKNDSSFFQLLGLEMQSIFNSNKNFIDEVILKSSTEALFQFRNHLKDDKAFGTIIKKMLLEQATLKLRTAKLQLLDSEFLDNKNSELGTKIPSHEDLFQLNVFYNSVSVKSLHSDDIPNLNFGDVFIDDKNNYHLCITALCDCYYPNSIEYNFYFVKGQEFDDIETALRLGDTAFISFLPNGKAVYWGNLAKPNLKKISQGTLSKSESDPKRLKADIKELNRIIELYKSNLETVNETLHKPLYIKPKVYNIENNKLNDNKLVIWDITNKKSRKEFNQNLNCLEIEYITTLRNDYTQRIANHAFGHPARVGVDFVKIK